MCNLFYEFKGVWCDKRKACGGFRKSKSLNVDLGEKLRSYFLKGGALGDF